MTLLCARHEDALQFALELRGFLRPSLTADVDLKPLERARDSILMHASNLAGRAAIEMLTSHACPLCFVNARNTQGLNLDGWIENAADEASTPTAPMIVHSV